ncbi:MAG: energy transducer TonB [Treponema sp.]|nr:energy transducer TonB [Treponema sp.]
MNSEKELNTGRVKLIIFAAVTILHIVLILTMTFNVGGGRWQEEPVAGIIRLLDLEEYQPAPPPPLEEQILTRDTIAQQMLESDEIPASAADEYIDYLPQHRISVMPGLPEAEIRSAIVYPPVAQRSSIEGIVFLELLIDSQGNIRNIQVLREDPPNWGFGQAAINALRGIRVRPAQADGAAVAVRFRFPIRFTLR